MNKATRKQISEIIGRLESLATVDAITDAGVEGTLAEIQDISSEIQSLADDEQDKFDNMPEGLQNGERGQEMQDAAEMLNSAVSTLESISIDAANLEEGWQEEVMDEILSAVSELHGI